MSDYTNLEHPQEHKKPPTFKAIGNLVLATKRFLNALNPSYDYGKRSTSPTINGVPSGRLAASNRLASARSASARTPSGVPGSGMKTLSGRPEVAGKQHGFKGNLLFKPLPPLASEQETTA
ncbi:hypothetical protein GPECTOR_26g512 [Gonium pectorale]|uniref:Uncharacterized protein n=1 Tax=Gonium pectorale TaxID=33097 RepID=A0A150GFJ6_GONPE|nr:hypothetical protein GPECTOR_26g512 [Gonium pectorale]|eukprot:KXZ48609.1 hypothetical protein GPECTOR_26g512 [Gonium pectorale]